VVQVIVLRLESILYQARFKAIEGVDKVNKVNYTLITVIKKEELDR